MNLETAGVSVGRIRRFLPEGAHPDTIRKRREKEQEQLSALMARLSDPEYAALYNDTRDRLTRAERATEYALAEAAETLGQAKKAWDDGLNGASILPDGTRVFRDADGDALTEDGKRVEGDELGDIRWRDDAISYEEYLARKKALDQAQRAYDAVLRYQVDILGRVRDRLGNEEQPPSKQDLRDFQDDIEKKMPSAVVKRMEPDSPAVGHASAPSADMDVPKL
ncbi:MAG: hypothetical protein H6907_09945 [Hyphomicrobiales bacterium]|nr:hypothetical protein [Hyphomicrobiales bacterium]MCP5372040.1 hypothetical protein [Hyphomicrobiales bacterium]